MNKWIAIFGGMLLLWALFEFGAKSKAPEIQQDIQTRTAAAISDAGYEDVNVSVDGRDVTLTGSVAVEESIAAAEASADGVRGVRKVTNDVLVAAAYITKFCKNEESITLAGDVPDDDTREAFPERARDMFRFWNVEESLEVRAGSIDGFRRFMDQALIELGQLDAGCITLTDQDLLIKGSIRSERAMAGLKARMASHDDLDFTVRYELTLPVLSEQALACQEEANHRISRDETVLFSFDSDVVHEIGRQLLDEVVEISKLCPDVNLLVTGHTDSVGDKDYNIGLGQRRAEAVVSYMVRKGVAAERLSAFGLGFSQPIADNSTDEGRAANRRIEIRAREN
jgi:outer membrane protein OmpA-like peptidoglycan-associated protein